MEQLDAIPDNAEIEAGVAEQNSEPEPQSKVGTLVSANLIVFTIKTQIPTVWEVKGLGPKNESVTLGIIDSLKIGTFTFSDFPSALLGVGIKIKNLFSGIYIAPDVERNEARTSLLIKDGFHNRPRSAMEKVERLDCQLEIMTERGTTEYVSAAEVRTNFQDIVKVSKTMNMRLFNLDKQFLKMFRQWEGARYMHDFPTIRRYFQLLKLPNAYISMPKEDETSKVYGVDTYFGYYEMLVRTSRVMKDWVWGWKRAQMRKMVTVPSFPREGMFRELLEEFSVRTGQFSKLNSIPANLTSGDAVNLTIDLITVLNLNAVFQLDWEIADIELFDVPTLAACFNLWLMFPFSAVTQQTWRRVCNYLSNHFVRPFLMTRRGAGFMVHDENATNVSPLLDHLADQAGDQGRHAQQRRAWRAFFERLGSGSMTMPRHICTNGAQEVTSLRGELYNQNLGGNRFTAGIESKLHAGNSLYVELTNTHQDRFAARRQDAVAGGDYIGDPAIWHRFRVAVESFGLTYSGTPEMRAVKTMLDAMLKRASQMRDYYENMNRVIRLTEFGPLSYTTNDIGTSVAEPIPMRREAIISMMWTLDTDGIKADITNFDYVAQEWNVNAALNRFGAHMTMGRELFRKTSGRMPTDLLIGDPGQPVFTESYPQGYFRETEVNKKVYEMFQGDSLSKSLAQALVDEGQWDKILSFPLSLTEFARVSDALDLVIANRDLFGWDTAFVVRSAAERVLGTIPEALGRAGEEDGQDARPAQFKWSNVIDIPESIDDYYRQERNVAGIDGGAGRSVVTDVLSNNRFLPVMPGTVHVRPFMLGGSMVTDQQQLLSMLFKNQILSIPTIKIENKGTELEEMWRITQPELLSIFRFGFVRLERFADLQSMRYQGSGDVISEGFEEQVFVTPFEIGALPTLEFF
jgi:hypothetical protein